MSRVSRLVLGAQVHPGPVRAEEVVPAPLSRSARRSTQPGAVKALLFTLACCAGDAASTRARRVRAQGVPAAAHLNRCGCGLAPAPRH